MASVEHSEAAINREIEYRTEKVKELERRIVINKLKVCNEEKLHLMEKLDERESVICALRKHLKKLHAKQTELNDRIASSAKEKQHEVTEKKYYDPSVSKEVLCNKTTAIDDRYERLRNTEKMSQKSYLEGHQQQNELNATMILLQRKIQGLQRVVGNCDLRMNSLDEMLDSKLIEIESRNEILENIVKTKDKHLLEMRREHDSENKRRDKLLKEKDEQLSDMSDQLQETLIKMYKKEEECDEIMTSLKNKNRSLQTESSETINLLKIKTRSLERDIENRDQTIKYLEEELDIVKSEQIRRNEVLLKNLTDKDKQLSRQANKNEDYLNQVYAKNEELKGNISVLKIRIQHQEKDKESQAMKIKHLEEIVDNHNIENELLHNRFLEENDDELSELRVKLQNTLKQMHNTETEVAEIVTSQKTKIKNLNAEVGQHVQTIKSLQESLNKVKLQIVEINDKNEHLENTLNDNDLKQRDQLHQTVKRLQEKENEYVGTMTLLKNENQGLKADIENRNMKVNALEETLECKNTEINRVKEVVVNKIKEKDEQISTQKKQLQQALSQQHEKEVDIGETINSLKEQTHSLEAQLESCNLNKDSLEKELKRQIKETKDKDERLAKMEKESDNQISELRLQLKETSDEKGAERRDLENSLMDKLKSLESEIEHRDRKVAYLEDIVSSKNVEMSELRERNKILEDTVKDNNFHLQKQREERNENLKKNKESEAELESKGIEMEIERREMKELKEQLKQIKSETNHENDGLVDKVKLKDDQLSKIEIQLKQALEQLQLQEAQFGNTITSLKKLNIEKDEKISELIDQQQQTLKRLEDNDTEMKEMHMSFKKKFEHFQSAIDRSDENVKHIEDLLNKEKVQTSTLRERNKFLEKKEKQNDEQIFERSDQLNRTLKKLQETETELGGTINSLKKQNLALEKDITFRDAMVKKLEEQLNSTRTEMKADNDLLEKKLKDMDKQFSNEKALFKDVLKETEVKFGENIVPLENQIKHLEAQVECRDLKISNLEKMLKNKNAEVSETSKRVANKVAKEKNKQISELRIELQQMQPTWNDREAEIRNIETSHSKEKAYFESKVERRERDDIGDLKEMLNNIKLEMSQLNDRNKFLEKSKNENENQIRGLSDQVKRFHKTETASKGIIISLKKKNQSLEKDIEHYSIRVKNLEENMRTEINGVNERLQKTIQEKDQQLSEQRDRLQKALNKSIYEKEAELGGIITSLKNQNQRLDKQISELRDRLKQSLKTLDDKEGIIKELDSSLKINSKLLNADVERHARTIGHLEETLSSKNVEITQLSARNELLENKVKEKDDQLRGQGDQIRQTLKEKHETEIELNRTITTFKENIEHLQTELNNRDVKLKDLEKMTLCKKIKDLTDNEQDKDVYEKEQRISDLKDQLQQTLTKLHNTETELDDTKTRLSKAMGDKLTDNNPNITDLSDKNRPTKLAERCAELYDNQWTDAFDILEKYFKTEENIIEVLLQILLDAMTFCKTKAFEQMEELGRVLDFSSKHDRRDNSAGVRKLLKDCRKVVTSAALENLYKMYVSHLTRLTDEALKTAAIEVDSFSKECLEICWFMVIQEPPVVFAPLVKKGSSFNTDLYKPYTRSGTQIDFVVWPPLRLHEDGPILAKGVAQGYGAKSKTSR